MYLPYKDDKHERAAKTRSEACSDNFRHPRGRPTKPHFIYNKFNFVHTLLTRSKTPVVTDGNQFLKAPRKFSLLHKYSCHIL